MTTTVSTGAVRPQSNIPVSAARKPSAVRAVPAQPERRAEDPFSAANGTLRFSSERKAAASDTRSASSASRGTATRSASSAVRSTATRSTSSASRGTATRSTSSARRSAGSGSGQPPKRRRRSKKKARRLLIIAICTLVFAVVVLLAAILLAGNCGKRSDPPAGVNDTPEPSADETPAALYTPVPVSDDTIISRSVTVAGVSVKDLTVSAARTRVKSALDEQLERFDITVAYESYEPLSLSAERIGLRYSEEALNEALALAANGAETAISVPLTYDHELLKTALYELNDKIPNHAVNASAEVKYKSKEIDKVVYYQPYWSFTESENGAKIDFDALEQEVTDAIATGDFTASLTPRVTVSEPEITTESLKAQLTLLSSYQTNYATKASSDEPELDRNNRNRDINISKAVSMMQVVSLAPGRSFDFNKMTGERSEKKGWALANAVYQGNTYRPEPGGGVCQVSTTIFNAILRAGLTNYTRKGHSIPSNYVTKKFEDGLGLDATVDYGNIEFKFKNDTGHTIYMFVYITKNNSRRKNINVEIYGQKQDGIEYRVHNEILEQTPSNDESKYEYEYDKTMLESARPILLRNPHDGYKVKVYVDQYKDGKFVKTVHTEETTYKVIYPKYKVGTAVITPKPTNTPKPTATPKPDQPDPTPAPEEEP